LCDRHADARIRTRRLLLEDHRFAQLEFGRVLSTIQTERGNSAGLTLTREEYAPTTFAASDLAQQLIVIGDGFFDRRANFCGIFLGAGALPRGVGSAVLAESPPRPELRAALGAERSGVRHTIIELGQHIDAKLRAAIVGDRGHHHQYDKTSRRTLEGEQRHFRSAFPTKLSVHEKVFARCLVDGAEQLCITDHTGKVMRAQPPCVPLRRTAAFRSHACANASLPRQPRPAS
jgi:hypothetical protein